LTVTATITKNTTKIALLAAKRSTYPAERYAHANNENNSHSGEYFREVWKSTIK